MSGIADALDALARPAVKQCGVDRWLDEHLDADDRAKVAAFLANGGSRAQTHQVLVAHGFGMSLSAFNNHLSRRCPCPQIESVPA